MAYKRSVFPEGGYDVFPEVYDISPDQEVLADEYYQLSKKTDRTPEEEDRYNYLDTILQNNKITPEHMNKFGDAVTGVQKFFVENTQVYIDDLKTDAYNTIDTAKDNALISIENKKDNVIEYMDSTTAGQIRNDIGAMWDLTTEDKANLVSAINEVNAKEVDLTPIYERLNELATNKNTAKQGQVLSSNGDGTATFKDRLLIPPSPINNLTAITGDRNFALTFNSPSEGNFSGVRLVYKIGSFPKSLTDGVVVEPYNSNQIVLELINATDYYCRLFTYDTDGDYNDSFDEQTIIVTPKAPEIYGVKIDTTNSNPETAVTYTDMAIGFTPAFCNNGNWQMGSWEDKFPYNQIKPCLLKSGIVNYYINPNDYTKKLDGSSADITSGNDGDVMIEFPKIYWKFERIGTDLYVRYSDTEIDSDYKCLAHTVGTTVKDKIYLPAYRGFSTGEKLRSLSGKTPTGTQTIGQFRTLAQANGGGYQQMCYYPLLMLQVLAIVMGKNRNTQVQLGRGFVDDNTAAANTGQTNLKGMFYGENTGKLQNKFCGIEDFYGNQYLFIDGMYSDASRNMMISDQSAFNDTGSGYVNYGIGATANIGGYIGVVQGGTETGFIIKSSNGSATTHYSDYGYLGSGYLPAFGGDWSYADSAGAFHLRVIQTASTSHSNYGAALCFIGT